MAIGVEDPKEFHKNRNILQRNGDTYLRYDSFYPQWSEVKDGEIIRKIDLESDLWKDLEREFHGISNK